MKNRKISKLLLISGVICSSLVLSPISASFASSHNNRASFAQQVKRNEVGTVRVKTALNVRSRATTRSSVIGTLRNNQKVTILGTQGNFYKINYRGKTGYVSKDYVSVAKTKSNTNKKPAPKKVVKNNNRAKQNDKKLTLTFTSGTINVNSYLNIRNGASPEAGITGSLGNNQKVDIVGQLGNFYKIYLNGRFGYISKDFVMLKNKNPMKRVKINAKSGLNLRAVASATGTVIHTIPDNVTLTVLGTSDKWIKVSYNGHTGWISSEYATIL